MILYQWKKVSFLSGEEEIKTPQAFVKAATPLCQPFVKTLTENIHLLVLVINTLR